MSDQRPPEDRTFIARLSRESHSIAHIQAGSWVEAAILYAELMALEPDEDGAISITVEEPDGERHCFRIESNERDLGAG